MLCLVPVSWEYCVTAVRAGVSAGTNLLQVNIAISACVFVSAFRHNSVAVVFS